MYRETEKLKKLEYIHHRFSTRYLYKHKKRYDENTWKTRKNVQILLRRTNINGFGIRRRRKRYKL